MTIRNKTILLAAVLTALTGCASTGKQESTGQYIDNSAITAKVKANLLSDATVKSLPISVESYKGTVLLSGFVNSYEQKKRAIAVAKSVPGVVDVQDSLIIK